MNSCTNAQDTEDLAASLLAHSACFVQLIDILRQKAILTADEERSLYINSIRDLDRDRQSNKEFGEIYDMAISIISHELSRYSK